MAPGPSSTPKVAGIVGGIAPESTIVYYRLLLTAFRKRRGASSAPTIVLDSIDVDRLLALAARDLGALRDYLAPEIARLARAGADAAILAANTPHLVFDELRASSPIPLVSIVEATRDAAKARGLRRLGLLGTRFTMEASFYPDVFRRAGLTIVLPEPAEREVVHAAYVGELVKAVFRDETRARILAVIDAFRTRNGIDGVILGGTELPLLLTGEAHDGLPLLDTTRIHVEAFADALWGA